MISILGRLEGRLALTAAAVIGCTGAAHAGDDKFAGAFMADGGGARALAMGSAFVAVADDASTSFWNPAGLLDLTRPQILLMHSERFGDLIDRDFVSYAQPLSDDRGAFAISAIRLGIDDIAFTSHIDLDGADGSTPDGVISEAELYELLGPQYADQIRYESDQEWAFFGSYARRMRDWQVGGNVKFIRQAVGDYSSFGLGIDLGLLRRAIWRQLDVGLKLQDATSTYLSWSTGRSESIDPVVVPGAAYRWSFPSLHMGLRAAAASEFHFDSRGAADQFEMGSMTGNLHLGLEATLREHAHLRLGSHGGFETEHLTFGAGLSFRQFDVDYAFAGDVLDIDENTHRVSLGYEF